MVPAETILAMMRDFPVVTRSELLGSAPVLVLSPHPDDESLGCGGMIAACRQHGQAVHVVMLTDGTGSHPNSREYPMQRLAELRMAEARDAVATLGVPGESIEFLGLPDRAAPRQGRRMRDVAGWLAGRVRALRIGTICTTWLHDPHGDHKAAWLIAREVARETGVRMLSFPVWGWTLPATAWLPAGEIRGARLDISGQLPVKRRAIACHRSQLTDLINDDPDGFRLSGNVLDLFDRPYEVFSEA